MSSTTNNTNTPSAYNEQKLAAVLNDPKTKYLCINCYIAEDHEPPAPSTGKALGNYGGIKHDKCKKEMFASLRKTIDKFNLYEWPKSTKPIDDIVANRKQGIFYWQCSRCGEAKEMGAELAYKYCQKCLSNPYTRSKPGRMRDVFLEEFGIGDKSDVLGSVQALTNKADQAYQLVSNEMNNRAKIEAEQHLDVVKKQLGKI